MGPAPLLPRRCAGVALLAVLLAAPACGGGSSGGTRPTLTPSRTATRTPVLPAASATAGPQTRITRTSERSGDKAAPPEASQAATGAAKALRDVTFALESTRLMEDGTTPPTAVQLAEADAATGARQAELAAALQRLEGVVRPRAETAPTG